VCPTGSFLADDTSDAAKHDSVDDCDICPAGRYHELAEHDSLEDCTVCASGRYADGLIATGTCFACPAGTELADDGHDAPRHDSVEKCANCVPGKFSQAPASQSCSFCEMGKVSSEGAAACIGCPDGSDCSSGVQMLCAAGRYSNEETRDAAGEGEEECADCEPGYRCPGGINQVACLSGTYQSQPKGTSCLLCQPGK
jgi:hypothetical protein